MFNRFMDHHPRRPPKRAVEPVDEWLQNVGYYRKHEPKDPTCLFRAVSEQVYHSQRSHIKVRKECVEFMRKNKHLFEEKISIPYDSYLNQMECFTEWGGMNEILAMSSLYKRNIVIFHGQKFTKETVVDHGHKENLLLCFTPPKQYETVMTREYTANAGFCQSLVYQTLYKNVFKMNNIDAIVHKMLHERNTHLRHDKFFLKGNLEMRNQLTEELMSKLDENIEECEELQLLSRGITSFPYRVAKALDPNIYRNVDFDIWHEIRRDVRNCGYTKFNPNQLQPGSQCLVQIDYLDNDKINNNFMVDQETYGKALMKSKNGKPIFYTGHIQEMSKNEGPVLVFVVELGQKISVPYESLKPFPQRKVRHNNWVVPATRRNPMTQNVRWRRPGNTISHKMKFHVTNDILDKNQMNTTKTITKNVVSKSEWKTETILDNRSIKLQGESYTSYQEYSTNAPLDNIEAILENTHISSVEMVEKKIHKEPDDILRVNSKNLELEPVKEVNNNCENLMSQPLDENHQHFESTDLATQGPSYPSITLYPIGAEIKSNGVVEKSESDLKDESCPGPVTNDESMSHPKNISHSKSWQGKRQSPPRQRNPECINFRQSGQKLTPRNLEYRNSSALLRDSHQLTNADLNRNQIDIRHNNSSNPITSNSKEVIRGNKSNGLAPRFKRTYEGRNNRNDHHNGPQQHQYRHQTPHQHQQQLAQPQYQQQHQDYDPRNNKKSSEAQSNANRGRGMNEANQMQQQHQQQQQQPQPQYQHQLQQQQLNALLPPPQQQQQPHQNMMRPQTPPPPYPPPYPVQYNHQMPFVPIAPYPMEPEAYPGQYYQGGYVQVPYMPGMEMMEGPAGVGGPVYTEGGPGMPYHVYPGPPPPYGMYQPHGLPHPPPPAHMYAAGPAGGQPTPQPQLGENCYAPYPPAQPYFFSYPGPVPPPHQLLPAPQSSAGPHTPPSHQ